MTTPPEMIVYDAPEPCPYLPDRFARLPLRLPLAMLRPEDFDARLEQGDRRMGQFLYATHCEACTACEPIRLAVDRFQPSKTQARVWKRGQNRFHAILQAPRVDEERIALYNLHKWGRGLHHEDRSDIEEYGYAQFLTETCCDSREICYYVDGELAMVAILDVGKTASSAVYTYFNPAYGALSPGTYSVLYELDLARQWGQRHLYLGFYVAANAHMRYKATYRPHERRIAGAWREIS